MLAASPTRAECGALSAIEFVETTYQKQARLHAENVPLSQEDFLALFSRDMRKLMQAPRRTAAKAAVGPVLKGTTGALPTSCTTTARA